MARPYRLPSPKGAPARALRERLRIYLRETWRGRVLIGTLVILFASLIGIPLPSLLTGIARLSLVIYILSWSFRLSRVVLRRLLWRIRTKLLVSYVFIGFVPVVLLMLFFVIAGVISMELVSSYMISSQVDDQAEALKTEARLILSSLTLDDPRLAARLEQRLQSIVPSGHPIEYALFGKGRLLVKKGQVPSEVPDWVKEGGFAGLVGEEKNLRVRALARQTDSALILDRPLDSALLQELQDRTGIAVPVALDFEADKEVPIDTRGERGSGISAVAGLERTDWGTGKASTQFVRIRFSAFDLLKRLSPRSSINFGDLFVRILVGLGGLFLVVYVVALVLGLLLAWSITGSVHALSRGTERLRNGDFSHPIKVRSRDQLGELAESFNMMVQGILDLLREQVEKERLEEELRIARQIQMSLLPEGSVALPGLSVDALCLPAAEVGGDYYDLILLSKSRMGILVADVSGKGTSAALYMAELKGLVMSLARIYPSPAKLLSEANSILTAHLDSRSFVTMTYAVVDTEKKTMRFARAGHSPMIHLEGKTGRTRVHTPQGIGLGIDSGDRFDQILEEAEVPLVSGDVFFFFTDGLSEAMNLKSELFGEQRLRELIEASQGNDPAGAREGILAGIRTFSGGAAQHDDMTLVILKVA